MKRRQAGTINLTSAIGAKKNHLKIDIFGSFDSFSSPTDDFVIFFSAVRPLLAECCFKPEEK